MFLHPFILFFLSTLSCLSLCPPRVRSTLCPSALFRCFFLSHSPHTPFPLYSPVARRTCVYFLAYFLTGRARSFFSKARPEVRSSPLDKSARRSPNFRSDASCCFCTDCSTRARKHRSTSTVLIAIGSDLHERVQRRGIERSPLDIHQTSGSTLSRRTRPRHSLAWLR